MVPSVAELTREVDARQGDDPEGQRHEEEGQCAEAQDDPGQGEPISAAGLLGTGGFRGGPGSRR